MKMTIDEHDVAEDDLLEEECDPSMFDNKLLLYDPTLLNHELWRIKMDEGIIESSFSFSGEGNEGHKFRGTKPKLVYPFDKDIITSSYINKREAAFRLIFALEKVLNPSPEITNAPLTIKGVCIVCFENRHINMFQYILRFLKKEPVVYTPLLGKMEEAEDESREEISVSDIINGLQTDDRKVLVTDIVGVRGMEFRQVIIAMDLYESILAPHLIEGMARCIQDLALFPLCTHDAEKKKGKKAVTFDAVIHEWKRKTLVDVQRVRLSSKYRQSSRSRGYYDERIENGEKIYEIYPQHQHFTRHRIVRGTIVWRESKGPMSVRRESVLLDDIGELSELSEEISRTKGVVATANTNVPLARTASAEKSLRKKGYVKSSNF